MKVRPVTPADAPAVGRLGFDAREPLALLTGRPQAALSPGAQARPMTEADLPACADLCRRVHGFDRLNELSDAVARPGPIVLTRAGQIRAYASVPNLWFANHGVAETDQDMFDPLAGCALLTPGPLSLLLPIRQAALFRWCLAQGLRIVKPMTLMAMGAYHEPRSAFYPSVEY